jgi:hypothetical protein
MWWTNRAIVTAEIARANTWADEQRIILCYIDFYIFMEDAWILAGIEFCTNFPVQ